MNSKEIQENLTILVGNLNKEEFIYDFLLSYGISKTSVTRLKKGDFNLSKTAGEVLYKSKVFFKTEEAGKLLIAIEEASKDQRILKSNPRFIITTDFETLVARDLRKKINLDIRIAELPKYYAFFQPLVGGEAYKSSNDNKADRDAAYKLGELYEALVTSNPDYNAESHNLNVFLSRLLFCFFAEDTGIFEKESVFTETLARHTSADGSDVHVFLNTLFRRLNQESGDFTHYLENDFPYVNGGLFRDSIDPPIFTARSRKILLECGDLDWSEINPDIFGSMIQAVADPEERSDLGMHYTSVPNIKKLIEPLFLDEFKNDFQKNYDNANNLKKLIGRMAKIKFFDPACGSGNFLIITYKEIRLLEIEIIQRLIELEKGQLSLFFTAINLAQFYGIEIKDFAHEMAILSLWLAEHQMNKVFELKLEGLGKSKPILPLKAAGKVVCANAARIDWETVCPKAKDDEIYILGNPPYLGSRNQDENQKNDMKLVFKNDYKSIDYVSIWFHKGAKYIVNYNAQLAFVSTNSICQGLLVGLTWPRILNEKIEFSFAYQSFKWANNAKGNAGVTVIVLGLRNKSTMPKYLFFDRIKKEAKNINAYLLDSNDIFIEARSKPLSKFPTMNFGNMPNDGGNLLFEEEEYQDFVMRFPNEAKYIKKYIGGSDFINGLMRYTLFIDDIDLVSAKKNVELSKRLDNVYKHRIKSTEISTREKAANPNHFYFLAHKNSDSIIIPRVSSERREYIPLGFLNSDTIIADSAMAVYDAQPWLFGVIHSKMHMVWVNTVGGKLETRYRYSAKLCYNTFPFPDINAKQKETINQYVFQVLDERAKLSEKTMAWMYNPETMPKGLKQAHIELDEAIERTYRLNPFQNDAERLEHLFKLYEEMTKKNTLFAKQKKTRIKKVEEND